MDLRQQVAIVTGAAAGIGQAIALALARHGARVAVVDRQPAEATRAAIQALGGEAFPVTADVGHGGEVEQAVAAVVDHWGRVDILVNNAGINQDAVVWKMTEAQWDAVVDVNLKGAFHFIRTVAPLFKAQGSGKIVNIASINGLRGKFGQANYAASKAGLIGLTKSVARELGRYHVNVNAIAPGLIETEMTRALPPEARAKALGEIVLERIGQPEDVAHAVVFLCSAYAQHVTGEVLKVDGGQYI